MGSWMVWAGGERAEVREGRRGRGRPCGHAAFFPAVQVVREVGGASDSAHRRSAGHSICVAETGTRSAVLHVPGAFLGGCRHARCCATTGAQLQLDISVVSKRLIPMVPSVLKTIVISLLQCVDKVVNVPVVLVVQVPRC